MNTTFTYYLSGLLALVAASSALADVADHVKQAEGRSKAGQYVQAEQLYARAITEADPNKPTELEIAFAARRKLPVVYLATDRLPQAQAAISELLVKHTGHERLPHALHEIVEQAKGLNTLAQAGQIYQALLTANPNQPQAVWLKMGIAIANVHLGDDRAVDTALQNIIAEHAGDDRAAESLGQVAWAYRKLGSYDKARTVYQYVVDNWPSKDRAIFSQRGMILCSLELKDQETADKLTEELFRKFPADKNLALIAWTIAQEYRDTRDWPRTRSLCQYILTNHPKAPEALRAQQTLIFASIAANDGPAVEAGIGTMLTMFNRDKALPSAVYATARQLNGINDAKAQELYQYVINEYAEHAEARLAKVNLGAIQIRRGNPAAAESMFGQVMATNANDPALPEAVHLMAEGYYLQAFQENRQRPKPTEPAPRNALSESAKAGIQKAIDKWTLVADKLPADPAVTGMSCYFLATAYYQLHDYPQALKCAMQMLERWPGHEQAWRAQMLIGKIAKEQMGEGTLEPPKALASISASFQQMLQKSPPPAAASIARTWLQQYGATAEGGEQ